MAADDDVLHFEVRDGEGYHSLGGEVCGREDVGDVSVYEDVAGLEAEDSRFGDSAIECKC